MRHPGVGCLGGAPIYIVNHLLLLVLIDLPIVLLQLLIDPVVNIVMADNLQLVFGEAGEELLQAHCEVVLTFVNMGFFGIVKTSLKMLFDWLHQSNILVAQNTVLFHVAH